VTNARETRTRLH